MPSRTRLDSGVHCGISMMEARIGGARTSGRYPYITTSSERSDLSVLTGSNLYKVGHSGPTTNGCENTPIPWISAVFRALLDRAAPARGPIGTAPRQDAG